MNKIRTGNFSEILREKFDPDKTVIITDTNVDNLYSGLWEGFRKVVVSAGEINKTLGNIEYIYSKFLEFEVDRDYTVIGVGGGVVTDMAGFAAATYLRGIRFGFFPTTLLAQTDAALGGKNGVDFFKYKNIIGTFRSPDFVYNDPAFLKSLSDEEYLNGVSEILKYGFITDREFLKKLYDNRSKILGRDESFMKSVIERSVEIKMAVVESDMTEKDRRRVLNFGHTFGHAYETLTGVSHGKAVAAGMVASGVISENLGYLGSDESGFVIDVISSFGLPVRFDLSSADVMDAIRKDKKRSGSEIHFVLLKSLGNAFIKKIDIDKLGEFTNVVCQSG